MREGGPHAENGDWQAGDQRGHFPGRPGRPTPFEQVIGDLPNDAEDHGGDGGPASEAAGPVTDGRVAGEPGMKGERGVGLYTDRQGDGGVDVQGIPDAG